MEALRQRGRCDGRGSRHRSRRPRPRGQNQLEINNAVVGCRIQDPKPGFTQGTGKINGVNFDQWSVAEPPYVSSVFDGNGPGSQGIHNVSFDQVEIAGVTLTEANADEYVIRLGSTTNFTYP